MKSSSKFNIRELVQNNRMLQNMFVMLLTGLMVLFLVLSFKDLAFVYGVAYNNANEVKNDTEITKVVEWSEKSDNKYELITTEGNTETIEKPEISYVMNNKKHLSYYSSEENILMLPVDDDFIKNMVFGNSSLVVLISWSLLTAIVLCACIKKSFVVLSKKRVFIVFLLLEIALLGYIGIAFWIFS